MLTPRRRRDGDTGSIARPRTLERVPVATIANSRTLGLVVHDPRWRRGRPRLGVMASIHGDEPLRVETVRRLVEELDADGFRGELALLPSKP